MSVVSKKSVIAQAAQVYEMPSASLGAMQSVYTLKPSDFFEAAPARRRSRKSARDEPENYLIIGFDTEFKTPENPLKREEIREGKGKYTVLSYQFHCIADGGDWSGICCADDGKRMALGQFLTFALGKGIQEKKLERIPRKIYLVGHFTRADIPAFTDFRDLTHVISAIRNTFISIDQPLLFALEDNVQASVNVHLRDTMLLSPGTSKSLDAIGELIGRRKIRLDDDADKEMYYKRNMDVLMMENWPLFREYALNDAIICAEYLVRVMKAAKEVTGIEKAPVTLTSIGVDLLLKSWEEREWTALEVVGRQKVAEKIWDKKLGRYKRWTRSVPLEVPALDLDFVTETYHGGRNEQFWFGPAYDAEWTDYDLSSAYPTAMALIGMPQWNESYFTEDLQDFQPETLGFAWVEFEFPPSVRFPTFPVRTQHGLVFPRTGRSYCSAPEIALARSLGCEMKLLRGLLVPTDRTQRAFGDFIRHAIVQRSKHSKKSFDALFWKEISNSTYGKTAQGLRMKRVYDIRDREMKPLPESRITNASFASYITSMVRAVLGETMNSIPEDRMVFSCTTDGFLTDANDEEIGWAQQGALCRLFASSREWLTADATVLEKKHQIAQPLGWRTRGQATLKPGPVNETDDSHHVVLARGGISIDRLIEDPLARSRLICDRFFNRGPDDIVVIQGLTGVRDMIECDADLIGVEKEKRLNMEYDWKRRPLAVGVHREYDHVAFSTLPWNTVEEFSAVREQVEEYNKKKVHCIKSATEFDDLASYVDSRAMLCEEHQAYMRICGAPDVSRLRQSLCAAWKERSAGFTRLEMIQADDFQCILVTADAFAAFLTDIGIPTKRTDVENAKRRGFRPRSVPATQRNVDLFAAVKLYMPDIIFEEIFAGPRNDALLAVSDASACRFIKKII